MIRWIWDWARYHNSHSSESIRVTKLFFCQNGVLLGKSFWPKDILVSLILFELWLLWYLAQSQIHRITLYFFCILADRVVLGSTETAVFQIWFWCQWKKSQNKHWKFDNRFVIWLPIEMTWSSHNKQQQRS